MIERQHRSTGRNSDTIASFLLKTYEILEHPENHKIICWDKDDIGFVVIDVINFTKEILPKYFRHANFSSFVRQLNMYDFHKVKQDNQMLVFKNPLFCRGEQHKLRLIKRKAAKKLGGQHRRYYNHQKPESQKMSTALKALKKSTETQINHSCLFLEKSIDFLQQNNESMKQKQILMNSMKNNQPWELAEGLYQLREQCSFQMNKTIKWLDEYLELAKRKLKVINNCNLQLQQSKKQIENQEKSKVHFVFNNCEI